jgi:hypothetical protein
MKFFSVVFLVRITSPPAVLGWAGDFEPLRRLRTTETTDLKRKQKFEQKATKATKDRGEGRF